MGEYNQVGDEWRADAVEAVTGSGVVTRGDAAWAREVADSEREGVASELVEMARPLLEGTVRQRATARRLLSSVPYRNRYKVDPGVQVAIMEALQREGIDLSRIEGGG